MSDPERAGGRLLVVSTPIGNLGDLSPRAREALERADHAVRRGGRSGVHTGHEEPERVRSGDERDEVDRNLEEGAASHCNLSGKRSATMR